MAVAGYNIAFSVTLDGENDMVICGRTQDDLTIAARTKESLTKDDSGAPQVAVTGHDMTLRATGLVCVTGDDYTRDDVLLASLLTEASEDGCEFDYTYIIDGQDHYYSGTCVITNYSESSNASDDATWTADFRLLSMELGQITPPGPTPGT